MRMLLKGDGLQPAGYLEIRAKPNFEVEIANCDPDGNVLAKMLLMASGEIRLTPAASARVVIDGDAETNRLLYAPAGGGAKRWLLEEPRWYQPHHKRAASLASGGSFRCR